MKVSFCAKRNLSQLIMTGIAFLLEVALCGILCFKFHSFAAVPFVVLMVLGYGFQIRISKEWLINVTNVGLAVLLAVGYLVLARQVEGYPISVLGRVRAVLCIMLFLIVALVAYLICGKTRPALLSSLVLLLLFEFINIQVIEFRGHEISPMDIVTIRTALMVAGTYTLVWNQGIFFAGAAVVFVAWFVYVVLSMQEEKSHRLTALVALIGLVVIFSLGSRRVKVAHWKASGTEGNGFAVNFVKGLQELHVKKPKQYDNRIEELQEAYQNEEAKSTEYPNIIVIMSESFTDHRVLGDDLFVDQDILSNLDSLHGNVLKGYALSSVYGGGTPNSEWEFLTGNSMAFLPSDSIAYKSYIKRAQANPSLVSNLKEQGYRCVAMHPYHAEGWDRINVYPTIGFDEMHFQEYFNTENKIRRFISDHELYEKMIQSYENRDRSQPLFLFAVTMQNHGGYEVTLENFQPMVSLNPPYDGKYKKEEQYFSILKRSDEETAKFLSYFENVPEKTVVLFFGDHQPKLDDDYLELVHGGSFDTLAEKEQKYMIPFFVWANYDIAQRELPVTSINYLSTYLYEVAGLPKTGYIQFLENARQIIPAINSVGYYSLEQQNYVTLQEAQGAEAEVINNYQALQYNNVFDKKNMLPIYQLG